MADATGPLTDPAGVAAALRFDPHQGLDGVDPAATPGFSGGKKDGQSAQEDDAPRIRSAQERLYANALSAQGSRRALLVVLQGRDAAGTGEDALTTASVGSA